MIESNICGRDVYWPVLMVVRAHGIGGLQSLCSWWSRDMIRLTGAERGKVFQLDVLVREEEEPWVQDNWVEDMASRLDSKREYDSPTSTSNGPLTRHYWESEDDDHGNSEEGDEDREPEALENLGNLFEKVGELDFFLCCGPGHVV